MSVPDPLSAAFHHSLFVFFLPRVCLQEESQTIVHLQNMEVTLWELPPPSRNNPIIPCSLRDTQAKVEGFKRYRAPTFAFRSCVCLRFD